jgi:hypothetical protein
MTDGTRGDLVAVGPDQCLYAAQIDSIEKITAADGTCPFYPTSPFFEPPPPPPPPTNGCQTQITLGKVTAVGGCLLRQGSVYVAHGGVRVNGIDVAPSGNGEIVFDPGRLRITARGNVRVTLGGSILLHEGSFEWSADKGFSIEAGAHATVAGFAIKGEVVGTWAPASSQLKATVSLGRDFGEVTGEVGLSTTNDTGLSLDNVRISLQDGDLRLLNKLVLKGATLTYQKDAELWQGQVQIELPGSGKTITGQLGISRGRFHDASALVDGLNIPLGDAIFLQRIGLSVQATPFKLGGLAGFTAGPSLSLFGQNLSAVSGDATLTFESGGRYDTWTLGGNVKLAGFDLGQGSIVYRPGLDVGFTGKLGLRVVGVGFLGTAQGWIEGKSRFQAVANGTINLPLIGDAGAQALVSNAGLVLCGSRKILFATLRGGLSWRFGGTPHLFTGACDFSTVEQTRSVAVAAQAGGRSVNIGAGRRAALIAVHGAGGAPRVALTGPGPVSIAGTDQGVAATPNAYLIESPDEQTTYVVLNRPRKGTYTATPLADSPPISSMGQYAVLPDPRARVRVTRASGDVRLLRWSLRTVKGQSAAFVERGAGVAHTLVNTRASRGLVRFRPAYGPGGKRRIVAIVREHGLPRRELLLAHFKVHGVAPRRVRGLRATRHGARLTVRWSHSGPATGYDVTVRLSDGRKILRAAPAGAHRARFFTIPRRAGIRIAVVTRGLGRHQSHAARLRLATPHR